MTGIGDPKASVRTPERVGWQTAVADPGPASAITSNALGKTGENNGTHEHPYRRYRRRPAMVGLGVALLAVCGGGAAYLTQLSSDTVPALVLTETVWRGQLIERSDLATAQAAADPAVDFVAAAEIDEIVGQRAVADLSAGTLLSVSAVAPADVPAKGQSVVGIAATEAQMPREELLPGDRVRVFETPSAGDDPPADSPRSISATVLNVSDLTDAGQVIVDVVVDATTAGPLAATAATGRIAIVLDSAEDGNAGK